MHLAFEEFAKILWGIKESIIVLTDNKALTRFFSRETYSPSLRNFCDQTLQFSFAFPQVPVVENSAADVLSRLDIRLDDRSQLKLTDSTIVFC